MNPLYCHVIGSGPDVVLLHGWGMHSGVWEDVVENLLDHYRVTLIDLPGHGYSRAVGAGHTLSELAAAVLAVAPPRAAWVGWSLGGLVAQQVALTRPERVSRLVLVNSTPCFVQRPDWPHGVAPPVLRRFAEELRQDYRAVLKRFIALEVHGSEHASAQLIQSMPRSRRPAVTVAGQVEQRNPVMIEQTLHHVFPDSGVHAPAVQEHHVRPGTERVGVERVQTRFLASDASSHCLIHAYTRGSFSKAMWLSPPRRTESTSSASAGGVALPRVTRPSPRIWPRG